MKVEVKDKVSEIKYPCLMIGIDTQRVVLFHKEKCGIVLDKGSSSSNSEIGYYSEGFCMNLFKLSDKEITLKND
jgi:hypothetical protein